MLLDRSLAAVDERADHRIVKGLRDMDLWRQRNRELVDLGLDNPHWPRGTSTATASRRRAASSTAISSGCS